MPAIRLTPDAVTAQERTREKAARLRKAEAVLNVVQGEQGSVRGCLKSPYFNRASRLAIN